MVAAPSPAAVLVLAQEVQEITVTPDDDTARMIAIVIGALLGLALLLAVLTAWYWRWTDPRKRAARSAAARPVMASTVPARPGGPAAPVATAAGRPAKGRTRDGGITADEWLRLTGPSEQSPPPRRS
jgi:hypothetical protein